MRFVFIKILFLSGISAQVLFAQQYDPLHPPNTYRNPDNPEYWKNRLPFEGYWQQDVHYEIKAAIDEKKDIITGSSELIYWNNSPDELKVVYFHLYQNAFQPDSYYDNLQRNNDVLPRYGMYESQKLGTRISKLLVNEKEAKTELDNTILKVYLPEPLAGGNFIKFDIEFKTYFDIGGVRRRMKMFNSYGNKHYDGVHWYPRISVYDRKFGWTTDQHLGKEFYGDFGTYDVELTFADNYVVEATGFLLNEDEVLPEELRKKLDIKNFADKQWDSQPSVITPYDSTKRKTWKYHAENVHDFAFTADPAYRIGVAVSYPSGTSPEAGNGIKCISLVQEPHASKWQNAADYTAKIIKVYSEDIGMYVYHKMIVADARDGMEYPMLTLDGGSDPGYRGLLAHEVGHNWFFGQVGNNETYRAALDEGFTQFLTTWSLTKIDGEYPVQDPIKSAYRRSYIKPEKVRENRLYYIYIYDAVRKTNTTLNTHSDNFNGALMQGGGYRQVYYKTATMLYNLQYVLGDDLFLKAMQHYFNQWKICHPYFEDFRNSIIQYTKVDLNWFFDQWLETSKTIDYGVKSVKKRSPSPTLPPDTSVGINSGKGEPSLEKSAISKSKGAMNEYTITFSRKSEMQMPIDFEVVTKSGERFQYHIPNSWFVKKTGAVVLPKWFGWDKIHPTYKTTIKVPGKIKNVVIDPGNRLADAYMLNNSKKFPLKIQFDSRLYQTPDWTHYEVFARPEIWYNAYDGIKTGVHLNGSYLKYLHVFDANVWFNTGLLQGTYDSLEYNAFDQMSYRFNYRTATDLFSKGSAVILSAKSLDGLLAYKIGFYQADGSGNNRISIDYQSLYRPGGNDLNYLLYPELWQVGKYNNFVNLGLQHLYNYKRGDGDIKLSLRSTTLGSDYSYSQIRLLAVNRNNFGKIDLNTRMIAQFGTGNNSAPESDLYAAGGNPEEMMENKYTRSEIITDKSWVQYGNTTNHFHGGGGLNLRGYSGYYIAQETKNDSTDVRLVYRGNTGAAVNAELEFQNVLGWHPAKLSRYLGFSSYLFGDIGIINYNTIYEYLTFAKLRADAGIGIALSIKKFGPLEQVDPLVIRFDMPVFINRTPAADPDFVQFRWVLGINRAF